MTVPSEANRVTHLGNGVTTSFSFNYLLLRASDMKVYIDNVLQSTGYSIPESSLNNPAGGVVNFTAPPADQARITLWRLVPHTQDHDYTPYDDFPAEAHETGLDLGAMGRAQLAEQMELSVRYENFTDTATVGEIPSDPTQRANLYLGYDASGKIQLKDPATASVPGAPTTPGDLWTYNSSMSSTARLPVGTNGQIPIADDTSPYGITWGTPPGGGNVSIGVATTDDDVMLGAAGATDIKNSGVQFSDVARRDVTNDFMAVQKVRAGLQVATGVGVVAGDLVESSGEFQVRSIVGPLNLISANSEINFPDAQPSLKLGNVGYLRAPTLNDLSLRASTTVGGALDKALLVEGSGVTVKGATGVVLDAGTGNVNASTGELQEAGQRVFSPNNQDPNSANINRTDMPSGAANVAVVATLPGTPNAATLYFVTT